MLWNDYCHLRIDFYNTMYQFDNCKRLENHFGRIFFMIETCEDGLTNILASLSSKNKNNNNNKNKNNNGKRYEMVERRKINKQKIYF